MAHMAELIYSFIVSSLVIIAILQIYLPASFFWQVEFVISTFGLVLMHIYNVVQSDIVFCMLPVLNGLTNTQEHVASPAGLTLNPNPIPGHSL